MKKQICDKSPDGYHHDKSRYNRQWNDMTVKLFNNKIHFMPESYDGYYEEPGKCIFCAKRFSKNT